MVMRHYCYEITNKVNGKIYVGIHSSEKEFLATEYYGSGLLIKRAVAKYGKTKFTRKVIEEANSRALIEHVEEMIVNEEFIGREDTYNVKTGGANGLLSEDTKNKIREAHRGTKASEATREKMSEQRSGELNPMYGKRGKSSPLFGRKASPATKLKMSEKMSGANNPNFGKHPSKESRAKMSNSHKGKTGFYKGKHLSEETKDKIRLANKGKKKPLVVCPHCGKEGGRGAMGRWHFDNCKFNKTEF
jgi:hypothetical protein